MSGLEEYMKRHSEAESRYLEQDQLRKDIEYANTIFHYVWYIRSRQRNSNTVKQTPLPLTDLDCPHPPSKKPNNVFNRKTHPAVKSNKRLKHSQTNKPVRNKTPVRPPSPPENNSSSDSTINMSLPPAPHCSFHTPDFSNTLSTAEDFPFPVSAYATYPCKLPDVIQPELNGIPCFVSCLQETNPTNSRAEVTAYGSMVEWNNLNI